MARAAADGARMEQDAVYLRPSPASSSGTIMRIGEKQSEVFDWTRCIYEPNGEVYESELEKVNHNPLDTGRLLYAKLRYALPREVEVEVLWDHFHDEVTAIMTGR